MSREAIGQTQPAPTSYPLSKGSILQRKCSSCGQYKTGGGTCTHCQSKNGAKPLQKLPTIQTKLTLGQPNDKYEQEADRVAEQIMRMPAPTLSPQIDEKQILRRTEPLVRRRLAGDISGSEAPPIVHEVLRSPGQSLELNTQRFMESRFGHDFSRVRVHADAKAAVSARAINAQAYTVGQDIVFAAGQYHPASSRGKTLLAHELAHTVQQSSHRQGMLVQRMIPCPSALNTSDPTPSGWKDYHGASCVFHCCYRGILEDRLPTPEDPQNECFYDENGVLVDENHEHADCGGTPNQYDSASDWWNHTFEDEGGIWARGWGAFWESRGRDLNQHFEREGRRILECHDICNEQPWYLRGFCFQGCSPSMH
ncbi:MAG: DUF4157 domain-containing protein [Cyanobacteria bacterium P01_F01_bin.86]